MSVTNALRNIAIAKITIHQQYANTVFNNGLPNKRKQVAQLVDNNSTYDEYGRLEYTETKIYYRHLYL